MPSHIPSQQGSVPRHARPDGSLPCCRQMLSTAAWPRLAMHRGFAGGSCSQRQSDGCQLCRQNGDWLRTSPPSPPGHARREQHACRVQQQGAVLRGCWNAITVARRLSHSGRLTLERWRRWWRPWPRASPSSLPGRAGRTAWLRSCASSAPSPALWTVLWQAATTTTTTTTCLLPGSPARCAPASAACRQVPAAVRAARPACCSGPLAGQPWRR